jgi:hypothetical protein
MLALLVGASQSGEPRTVQGVWLLLGSGYGPARTARSCDSLVAPAQHDRPHG